MVERKPAPFRLSMPSSPPTQATHPIRASQRPIQLLTGLGMLRLGRVGRRVYGQRRCPSLATWVTPPTPPTSDDLAPRLFPPFGQQMCRECAPYI